MNTRKVLPVAGGVLVLVVLTVLLFARWPGHQAFACVELASCLPSYRNTQVCEGLAIGMPERTLIFKLGQPIRRAGASLYFEPGALESGSIEVELDESKKAKRFFCHGRAPNI
jgi:hypothetical protein